MGRMAKEEQEQPRNDLDLEAGGTVNERTDSDIVDVSTRTTLLLGLGFFGGMCMMELALEGAGKWYGHLDSLAAAITVRSPLVSVRLLP